MCLPYCAHDPFDAVGEARLVYGALEECGLDTGIGDALADVLDEQFHHRLGDIEQKAAAGVMKLERHLVVGVDACRRNNIDVDLFVDLLNPGDVSAQPDHRRVDDGVDAA